MAAAWDQIGDVLAANQRLRRLRFAQQAGFVWHREHLEAVASTNRGAALALTAPVHSRVMSGAVTMQAHVAASKVPPVLVAPTMRRLVRPRSRLIRALPFDEERPAASLIERVNRGEVQTAPSKVTPPGAVTVGQVAEARTPQRSARLVDRLAASRALVGLLAGGVGAHHRVDPVAHRICHPCSHRRVDWRSGHRNPAGRPPTCAPSRHADRRGADAGIHRGPARQF